MDNEYVVKSYIHNTRNTDWPQLGNAEKLLMLISPSNTKFYVGNYIAINYIERILNKNECFFANCGDKEMYSSVTLIRYVKLLNLPALRVKVNNIKFTSSLAYNRNSAEFALLKSLIIKYIDYLF